MLRVIENSHFWINLKQILYNLKLDNIIINKEYYIKGIENTLKNGYDLVNIKKLIKEHPNDFELGRHIRKLYNEKEEK